MSLKREINGIKWEVRSPSWYVCVTHPHLEIALQITEEGERAWGAFSRKRLMGADFDRDRAMSMIKLAIDQDWIHAIMHRTQGGPPESVS